MLVRSIRQHVVGWKRTTVNSGGARGEALEARMFLSGVSFASPIATAVGHDPGPVAADFNGDGKPDLAVADSTGSSIRIMTGDGSGRFSNPVIYPTGNSPSSILPGDFNNDGKLDIAFNHWFGDTVGLMLGDGRGGFGPEAQFPAGGPSPLSNVAADFNRDGNLDMATAGWWAGGVRVLMGDGKGHFAPAIFLKDESNTQRVVTADFNRDGNPDLAVSNWGNGTVSVFLGDGRGGFARSDFAAGAEPISVKLGDFNRDGRADLAIGHGVLGEREGDVSLLVGNGAGGFAAPRPLGGPQLRGFDVADFNFDGNSDLAYRRPNVDDTIFVRLGDGKLGFAAPTAARTRASELALAGDYTGDRIPDLGAISAQDLVVTRNQTVLNGPVYEAEQAAITGAVVARFPAGFTGGGFVDFQHASGDAVEFTVLAPAAGWYDLFSRYALKGSSDRATALSVNGQAVPGGITFAPTGSWTNWLGAVRTVQLKAGFNTVRVEANGQSGPNLDSLTVRLSQPPVADVYQAESAIVSGAKFANDQAGYTGSGFVDFQHAGGDYVEFGIDVGPAGAAALDFRYANGGATSRPMELRVDGRVVNPAFSFAPTGGWGTWGTASQDVNLSAGRHTVRLAATGSSGPNLDALTLRPAPQFFSTGFDSAKLNPALEDPDKTYVIGNGVIHTTRTGRDSFRRRYIRTKRADYFDNFVYELTYSATGITFIGVGPGEPTAPFSEPARGSLYLRLHGPTIVGGRVDLSFDNNFNSINPDLGHLSTPGPHRARIMRTGDLIRFEVDADASGPFTADFGTTVDLSEHPEIKAALAKESRLFFGNGEPESSFDNVSVRKVS
jgi:hypothetical protein